MSSYLSSALIGGASRAVSACASPRVIARMFASSSSIIGQRTSTSILSSSSSSVGGSAAASGRIYTALTPELAEAASVCIADTFAQQSEPFTWLFNLKRHHWFSHVIPFLVRASHGAFFATFISIRVSLILLTPPPPSPTHNSP